MANGKYNRYFRKSPIMEGKFCPRLVYFSRQHEAAGEKNFSVLWNCITEPFLMVDNPHRARTLRRNLKTGTVLES